MELTSASATAPEAQQAAAPRGSHAPSVGRDIHARLSGTRPNADVELPPFWGEDGFTFDDLVDLVNPLHHIPLVGSLYRSLTGDQIAAGPRIMGGALFAGGPVGAMAAAAGNAVNAGIAHETGNDVGGHVLAWMGIGGDTDTETPSPAPDTAPVKVAAVGDLPLPDPAPVAAPVPVAEAAPQPPAPAPAPQTSETASLPDAPVADASLAAIAAGTRPPNGAAPRESSLSDHQWQMLVASLEPQEVTSGNASLAASPTPTPAPAQQPADIAAAMMRALDKYETLTRTRAVSNFTE